MSRHGYVPFPTSAQGSGQVPSAYPHSGQPYAASRSQPAYSAPPPQYATPSGGAQTATIQPGSLTYTTSRNSKGETVYHAFIAQAVNYRTSDGIVQGIQWVPAEDQKIEAGIPQSSGGPNFDDQAVYVPQPDVRGMSEKQKEKALRNWQKDNKKEAERRQRKLEKEQEKQWENEERERLKAEAKEKKDRERRISTGNGVSFDRGASVIERKRSTGGFDRERERKVSTGFDNRDKDRERGRGSDWDRERKTSGGMLGLSRGRSQSRPRQVSTGGFDGSKRASGVYDQRQPGYPTGDGYQSPASTASAYPYVNTTALHSRYGDQPSPSGYPSTLPPPSPGHASRGSAGYHSTSKQPSPRISGSHSPYMAGGPFPPGHIMHGTSQGGSGYVPRPTLSAGGGHAGTGGGQAPYPGLVPAAPQSYGQQPFGPVDINREANRALPYTWFEPFIVIADLNNFFTTSAFPIMPAVMQPHDVTHDEWIHFVKDIMTAWTRRGSPNDGKINRVAAEVAEIIETWGALFFQPRGVEVVLFRDRERRSGPLKGRIEERLQLPNLTNRKNRHDSSESSESSLSSTSDSEDDESDHYRYGGYGARVGAVTDHPNLRHMQELRYQRRAEKAKRKAEKRRRAKERKRRRERELVHSIGMFCISQRTPGPAGHQGIPPAEYGARPLEYGARYGTTPAGTPGTSGMPISQSMPGGAHSSSDPYAKYVPVSQGSTAIPPLPSQGDYRKYVDTKPSPYHSSPAGMAGM